jgi:hypothetical protein
MSNLKTAINGEHVRVGNNDTLKATAIGDLLLEQEGTKKTLFLENVMLVPAFARNLINVGRLVEKGNEFISTKTGLSISNESGERPSQERTERWRICLHNKLKEETRSTRQKIC